MGHVVKMIIKKFEPKYRDDLIFMILEAKNSLGRIPGLNEDLLDISKTTLIKEICFGSQLMNLTASLEVLDIIQLRTVLKFICTDYLSKRQ